MTEDTETRESREPGRPTTAGGRRRRSFAAAAVLAAALAGGAVGAVTTSTLAGSAETTTVVRQVEASPAAMAAETNGDALDASQIYESVADGVVEIAVSGTAGEGPFGETVRGQGSGFVYDDQGHVVTNYHVVEGATSVEVTLADGSSHPARVVGSDPSTDLAVLEVDAPPGALQPLAIGDSDALQVGEPVVAIGSPFGLDATVTSGIVSAVDRRITAPNGFAIDEAIQTDAAINKGNSGGPLLNSRAEVVGVNSQIETESGGNVGIGFAVPTSTVQEVVSQILETGSVEHAFLGVGVATVPADAADELGAAAGVAVTEVRDGSPAAEAGLRPATGSRSVDGVPYPTGGDVVTAVAGTEVATAEELQDAIDEHAPGDQVDLTVVRGGETLTVTVTLGTRPS